MKAISGDEAISDKIPLNADGPIHLPHDRPSHQHILRALPL